METANRCFFEAKTYIFFTNFGFIRQAATTTRTNTISTTYVHLSVAATAIVVLCCVQTMREPRAKERQQNRLK